MTSLASPRLVGFQPLDSPEHERGRLLVEARLVDSFESQSGEQQDVEGTHLAGEELECP